ncbi:DUF1758 domain-containing protein [Trichonephila clavipes]|nr:DUF1758 domain-containing protein [Trichonephila clavipes]
MHVQFASRLTTNFDYYLKLRKVTDFDTLKELIISDKMFQTLDREMAAHINIRQSGDWFRPLQLGKECDLYFTSSGKPVNETRKDHKYSKLKPFKTAPKVFLNEEKNKNCDLCLRNENHPLYACPQFKRLSVQERVNVVKNKNACFKCLSPDCSVKRCSFRNCFCGKPHNKLIHFPKELKNVSSGGETRSFPDNPEVVNKSHPGGECSWSVPPQVGCQGFVSTNLVENKKNVILSTVLCLIKAPD